MEIDQGRYERAYRNAKADLEIDGGSLPDFAFKLFMKVDTGEITHDEFLKIAYDFAVEGKIPDYGKSCGIENHISIPHDFDFDKSWRSIEASFGFEGIYFLPGEKELVRQRLYREITEEEFNKTFMERIEVRRSAGNGNKTE